MSEIIKTEDLHYAYRRPDQVDIFALDGIDLTIERGQFAAVLGHNGSGKSTLAKHFNAILLPSGGKVYVGKLDTSQEENLFPIRKQVSMVFQNPDNQLVATVVEEDVAFALENMGLPPAEIRRRVDDALKAVNMYHLRTHAPHMLSGGQKQRIAIAGVIAMMPDCVVLDEPTAMLDPAGRAEVMAVIEKLNAEFGITVVLITHHMDEAARAGRVIVMSDGKVVLDGPPEEIFVKTEALRENGLTVPQTVETLERLNRDGGEVGLDALSVSKCADRLKAWLHDGRGTAVTQAEKTPGERSVSEETVLELRGLGYTYSAGTPFERAALSGVSVSIPKGAVVGIIGHTGSGKSTLIQHLNGLLRPTCGQVLLDGQDIWAKGYPIRSVRFRVGLVFQYPEYQLFEETNAKDIAFGPVNMGLSENEVRQRVARAMEAVGLPPEYAEKSPFELSGGQKRRVAIAGVIAMEPEVLILDEPTAGLDPAGRDEILSLVQRLNETRGATILLVTHSMEDIARIAQRMIVMNDGRILMTGAPSEVFSHAAELEGAGLNVPEVTRVMLELQARGENVLADAYTVGQAVEALERAKKGVQAGA